MARISSIVITKILKQTLALFYSQGEIIPMTAIESLGFTSPYASQYYSYWLNSFEAYSGLKNSFTHFSQ